MCDCIKQVPLNMRSKYIEPNLKEGESIAEEGYSDGLQNTTLILGDDHSIGGSRTYHEYTFIKQWTGKKGQPLEKKETVSILHTYCPFCGLPYEAPPATNSATEE